MTTCLFLLAFLSGCVKFDADTAIEADTSSTPSEGYTGSDALLYQDMDEDGFGDANAEGFSATAGASYALVQNNADCDDHNTSIHPGATEVCDGIDEDCDGELDNNAVTGLTTWYMDGDSDGFGDPDTSIVNCDGLNRFVADNTDCDDFNVNAHPGGVEICNTEDDDCDGEIDEDPVDGTTWNADADGDSYGDKRGETIVACTVPDGYANDTDDCDDGDASIHPKAEEHCDGVDEDCDLDVDENPVDGDPYYPDNDMDGYGDMFMDVYLACEAQEGFAVDNTDCDDHYGNAYPGAPEICDNTDNDCDGGIDEDLPVMEVWPDDDGDGYGSMFGMPMEACSEDMAWGYVPNNADCNDIGKSGASINPDATEIEDGIDNNCDGEIDEE